MTQINYPSSEEGRALQNQRVKAVKIVKPASTPGLEDKRKRQSKSTEPFRAEVLRKYKVDLVDEEGESKHGRRKSKCVLCGTTKDVMSFPLIPHLFPTLSRSCVQSRYYSRLHVLHFPRISPILFDNHWSAPPTPVLQMQHYVLMELLLCCPLVCKFLLCWVPLGHFF